LPPFPAALRRGNTPDFCPHRPPPKQTDASCADPEAALNRLAAALAPDAASIPAFAMKCGSPWLPELLARLVAVQHQTPSRDRRLAAVEACPGIQPGLVRLARASLWPECADALSEAALTVPATQAPRIAPELRVALYGHEIAAKLDRPRFHPVWVSRNHGAAALAQLDREFAPWLRSRSEKLQSVRAVVDALPAGSHGRAVAELALAEAWRRVWQRRVELSDEDKVDIAAREAFNEHQRGIMRPYWQNPVIDADAELSAVDVLADWVMLKRWPGTWRTEEPADILRRLVLAPLPELEARPGPEPTLAALLPAFVAARVLSPDRIAGLTLENLVLRGFDPLVRRRILARDLENVDARLVARARIVLSIRALEPRHAGEAVRLLAAHSGAGETALTLALAQVLARMPARSGWFAPETRNLASVTALDALATRPDVSPAVRAVAAYTSWQFMSVRIPISETLSAHEWRARQLMSEAGDFLDYCMPTGFLDSEACPCPTIGGI
jgi:hypothetical protein